MHTLTNIGNFVRRKHDYRYMVLLLIENTSANKFKCLRIWQSTNGFIVNINEDEVDFDNPKIDFENYEVMDSNKIYAFLSWLFEWIFSNDEGLTIK